MRFVIAICVGLFGMVVGALVGAVLVVNGAPPEAGGRAATIGFLVGLAGGYLLGRQTSPPKRRPPIDPGQYPNRVIRRDRKEM